MSLQIPVRLIQQVRQRADDVCEYCRLPQASQEATFHVDHVLPRSQRGPTELANLALACVTCSLRKSARTSAVDPKTGNTATLFNPRTDDWSEHFAFTVTWRVRGRTDTGRATIETLGMKPDSHFADPQGTGPAEPFSAVVLLILNLGTLAFLHRSYAGKKGCPHLITQIFETLAESAMSKTFCGHREATMNPPWKPATP